MWKKYISFNILIYSLYTVTRIYVSAGEEGETSGENPTQKMISLIYINFTNMYNNNKKFLRFFPYDDHVFNLKVKRKQTQRSAFWLIVSRELSWFIYFVNGKPSLDDAIVITVVVSLLCDQTWVFSRISLLRERKEMRWSLCLVLMEDERR